MFIQVIQGRISDRSQLENRLRRWTDELGPGAKGWLGLTGGVTEDNTYIGVVRFASETDAQRNSDRPEQDGWWNETSKLFVDKVTFHNCPDVQSLLAGGSDDAGFVQVMQGRVRDVAQLKALNTKLESTLAQARPDVIGLTCAFGDDGVCTQTVYFTSEADARTNERKDLPPEIARTLEEEQNLIEGLTYYDLRDPLLISPR